METLLEEVSFDAPELREKRIHITRQVVITKLSKVLESDDLSRFVL
jgi:ATP-dependent HslUV protease ATP-binding subunit HslU